MSDVTQILSQIETVTARRLRNCCRWSMKSFAKTGRRQNGPGESGADIAGDKLPLVHEAYIRLVDVDKAQHWDSRGHFFVAAAEAMRRILVEQARRKGHLKHGGGMCRQILADVVVESGLPLDDMIAVDDAIAQLEAMDPEVAKLVKFRFFAGLNHVEAGQILGVSACNRQPSLALRSPGCTASFNPANSLISQVYFSEFFPETLIACGRCYRIGF